MRGLLALTWVPGARTIIPDRATAAMDIRLVKETRPGELVEKLRAHVRAQGYHLVDGEPTESVRATHAKIAAIAVSESPTSAFRTSPLDPQARAHRRRHPQRLRHGRPCSFARSAEQCRSPPFIEALGFPAILVPTVNFDNNQHEENENLRLGTCFEHRHDGWRSLNLMLDSRRFEMIAVIL